MLDRLNGVWKETGAAIEMSSPPRPATFRLAIEFFKINLEDLHDATKYGPALRWFTSRGSEDEWSFEWVCGLLDWNVDAVRRNVLRNHVDPLELYDKTPMELERLRICPVLTARVRRTIAYRKTLRKWRAA